MGLVIDFYKLSLTKTNEKYHLIEPFLETEVIVPENIRKYIHREREWEGMEEDYQEALLEGYKVTNEVIDVIYCQESRTRSKLFNDDFYRDWDNGLTYYWLWTKKEVEVYRDLYAIDPDLFTSVFIDPFIDGESVVYISW